ncbi:unnamed protein product [marine sediment metagenome]|uniref:Uncharacterized protein n=1 Tax=marine sediment metagenome TaxID=412755 RepID=X1A6E6_9ZZZZ
MGIKLNELLESIQMEDTDLLHLRTVEGLDKRIFWANFFTQIPQVINHVIIPAEIFKLTAAKPAVINDEGIFITLDFVHTAEKEAYLKGFIPFRWDEDTDVEMRIDWLCDADGSVGGVAWGIEYLAIKDNEAVDGATATITEAFTGRTAGLMRSNHFTTKLLKANLEADDIISLRIFRDHDHAGDTLDQTARFLFLSMYNTLIQNITSDRLIKVLNLR